MKIAYTYDKPCNGKRGVEIDGVERQRLQKSCDREHRADAERRQERTERAELRHSRRDQITESSPSANTMLTSHRHKRLLKSDTTESVPK